MIARLEGAITRLKGERRPHRSHRMRLAAAVFAALGLLQGVALASPVASDGFDDGVQDTALWTVHTAGSGVTTAETEGKLHVSFAADAANGPDGVVYGGYHSACKVQGDFDMRVGFDVVDVPQENGTRLGLVLLGSTPITIERSSYSNHDVLPRGNHYTTNFRNSVAIAPTTDSVGALRLVRTGSQAVAYYLSGDQWVEVRRGTVTTSDVHLYLMSWTHSSVFSDQVVDNAFEDFELTEGRIVDCVGTKVQASPAVLEVLPGKGVATSLRATLSSAAGPLAGHEIVFTVADGDTDRIVCTATSDADGTATCPLLQGEADAVLAFGYEASFAGGGGLLASSDQGPVASLSGTEIGG